ncbi:MAG: OsmC family protein [Methylovulum sp.]|uniref:OsmC family protein n=1 Tax=Methylovulum sp. TaxID=1916980 RepID=UPI00261EEA70|nr:OsmC family protein [Methylovulum sp.]MDD2725456.1 OsmC family protein [Methylovulum sp.]MDD5125176.1 OsmC family protein [Methylovulum sp.]
MSQKDLKAALENTIAALQENPAGARLVFKAKTRLLDGVRCAAEVRDFPPLIIDEPPELGGGDAGVNPVELILAALGTCQEIVYAAYAAVLDIPLEAVEVSAKGHLDLNGLFGLKEVPSGFQKISFETTVKSPAAQETIEKLVAVVEAHCPVLDTLTRPVEVAGTVTLNGAPLNFPARHAA